MINDGKGNGIYKIREDKRLYDLKVFRSFLYQNFKSYGHYQKMLRYFRS